MQKIILDTNVVVSALISNSFPTFILYDLVLTRKVYIVSARKPTIISVLDKESVKCKAGDD